MREELAPLGVAPEHVLVAASHTHSGPDLFAWWEGSEEAAPAENAGGDAEAATRAMQRLEEAELSFGTGTLEATRVNRRDEAGGMVDGPVRS